MNDLTAHQNLFKGAACVKNSRRSIRLRGYDYSWTGAYFVTVCAKNRECLFGEISDGQAVLNDAGRMVQTIWKELTKRFPHLELDECVVMPNHVHGILVLHRRGEPRVRPHSTSGDQTSGNQHTQTSDHKMGDHKDRPYIRPHGTLPGTVGRIIQGFKSITTHQYIRGVKQFGWRRFNGKLWQRNYYEHVIRNDHELKRIREYILNNPARWDLDRENPNARPGMPVTR
ncbi:MAG: transposase [Deltaproteobacteria bacterium]|nr:transposase [Deltaproteobacteria bacterium]